MQQNRLSRLVTVALLTAISIVFRRFLSINTPIQSIGIGWLPILAAGMAYGPGWGFVAGALADFIGANLFPIGAYFPGFTLTAGLSGAIVPVLLGRNRWRSSYLQLFGAIALSELITSVALNTYWLKIITGKAAAVLLPIRVANAAAVTVVITSLFYALRPQIQRMLRVR